MFILRRGKGLDVINISLVWSTTLNWNVFDSFKQERIINKPVRFHQLKLDRISIPNSTESRCISEFFYSLLSMLRLMSNFLVLTQDPGAPCRFQAWPDARNIRLEVQPVRHKQGIFRLEVRLVGPVSRTTNWASFGVLLRRSGTWFGHRWFRPVLNCILSENHCQFMCSKMYSNYCKNSRRNIKWYLGQVNNMDLKYK